MYFWLYSRLRTLALEALQARGRALTGDIGIGPSLLVAFLAGCGNVLLTNPIWVVSTRMQVHSAARWHRMQSSGSQLPRQGQRAAAEQSSPAAGLCLSQPESLCTLTRLLLQ